MTFFYEGIFLRFILLDSFVTKQNLHRFYVGPCMYNTLQYSSQGEMITDRGAACHLRRSLIGGFDCRKTGDGVRTN